MDILRDSPLGQIIRFLTGCRYLLYPEEQPEFTCLHTNKFKTVVPHQASFERHVKNNFARPANPSSVRPQVPILGGLGGNANAEHPQVLAHQHGQRFEEALPEYEHGIILVDWYTETDAQNPQNWSTLKKSLVTAILWLYTFTVYCASAIYTPSIEGVMDEYGVDHTVSSLGLSLYVLGYGVGPLLFSPLSEIPRIGRNAPYIITLFLYVLMAIPTALTRSFPGFLVLRFLTGFLGSPCLATGGATLQDMYPPLKLPYGYTAWVGATFCAPALGPVISAFAVSAGGWRWSLWEVLWMSIFAFVIMFVFFPETSATTILFHRARRIRKRLHDTRFVCQSEMDEANTSLRQIVADALIRPLQITILDPAVFFTNFYSSYSYGVYYSYFEAFPLVYTEMYGFNLGLTGASFLSIVVACLIGTLIYLIYIYWYLEPKITAHGPGPQEERLIPAIFAAFLQPIGLFLFAWSSRQSVHWIVSMIGIFFFSTGGFILFQGKKTYHHECKGRFANIQ
ncbi:MFS general substrate transporter [Penicillium brevicompactum]|uniref:MFS general substrate transporter n=1 Tax=Penicillium brevicompactum TaxID=5074 RepID=A0A9W9QPE1_PENBR|nr:MFS general substrate transporter [Penicillium brevicompactum]